MNRPGITVPGKRLLDTLFPSPFRSYGRNRVLLCRFGRDARAGLEKVEHSGLFTTLIGTPSSAPTASTVTRAAISALPPAANDTTSVIGFSGYTASTAPVLRLNAAMEAAAILKRFVLKLSLVLSGVWLV